MLQKGTIGPARNRSLCPRAGKNNHVKDREDGRKDGQWTGPYCPTATRRTSCKRFPGLKRLSSVLHLCSCAILSFWDPSSCHGPNSESFADEKLFQRIITEKTYVPTLFVKQSCIKYCMKVKKTKSFIRNNVLINCFTLFHSTFCEKCRKLRLQFTSNRNIKILRFIKSFKN